MILNHRDAVEFITDMEQEQELTPHMIRSVHALLANGLVHDKHRGTIRKFPVGIGGTSYIPDSSPQILEECLDIICRKTNDIICPFEKSLFLMVQIPYLQPFIDVNKRTGRLAANIPLLNAGKAPLSFTGVDTHQYTKGLIGAYELNDPSLIAQAFTEGYVRSAKQYQQVAQADPEDLAFFARNRGAIKEAIRQHGIMWANGKKPTAEDSATNLGVDGKTIARFIERFVNSFSLELARLDGYPEEAIRGLSMAHEQSRKTERTQAHANRRNVHETKTSHH